MFFLFIIIIFIFLALSFSKLQFEIKDFIAVFNTEMKSINPNYKILIRIYILGKIKVLERQIMKGEFKSEKSLKKLKDRLKIQGNDKEKSLKLLKSRNIKKLKINIKKSDLKVRINTENAALTAILTGALYGIIPWFLNSFFNLKDNIRYKIKPIFENKNEIYVFFNGIFEIKLLHIINTYRVLIGKYKEENKNGTSDRKSYAYNNG